MRLSEFSSPKQYSRNSIPPVPYQIAEPLRPEFGVGLSCRTLERGAGPVGFATKRESSEKLVKVGKLLQFPLAISSCNFLQFLAMSPPQTACFCSQRHCSAGKSMLLQASSFSFRKMFFCSVGNCMFQLENPKFLQFSGGLRSASSEPTQICTAPFE